MNKTVSNFLAQHFSSLSFVTRAAGCVYPLPKSKKITIPVAPKVYTSNPTGEINCEREQDTYDLIPDSKEVGILYFEEERGAKIKDSNSRYNVWEGRLKLVFWGNMKKVGAEYQISDLEDQIVGNLPSHIPASGGFWGGTINWDEDGAGNRNPFRNYSYDEARTKYLSPPYGFFVKNIRYVVRAVKGCSNSLEINPVEC